MAHGQRKPFKLKSSGPFKMMGSSSPAKEAEGGFDIQKGLEVAGQVAGAFGGGGNKNEESPRQEAQSGPDPLAISTPTIGDSTTKVGDVEKIYKS